MPPGSPPPRHTVDAKVVTSIDRPPPEWVYEPDATVVEVTIDGHLCAEVVCMSRPTHSGYAEEQPYIVMRGVREQRKTDLGFTEDVFPHYATHMGDRTFGADDD